MPKKKTTQKKSAFRSSLTAKHTLIFVLLLIAGTVMLLLSGTPQQLYKEQQLKTFYQNLVVAEKTFDVETVYNNLSPEQRRVLTLEQFSAVKNADRKPLSMDFTIHSYKVDGDRGLIDRTLVACFTKECEGEDRFENRAIKEYIWVNGRWYTPLDNDTDEQGNIVEQNWPTVSPKAE